MQRAKPGWWERMRQRREDRRQTRAWRRERRKGFIDPAAVSIRSGQQAHGHFGDGAGHSGEGSAGS